MHQFPIVIYTAQSKPMRYIRRQTKKKFANLRTTNIDTRTHTGIKFCVHDTPQHWHMPLWHSANIECLPVAFITTIRGRCPYIDTNGKHLIYWFRPVGIFVYYVFALHLRLLIHLANIWLINRCSYIIMDSYCLTSTIVKVKFILHFTCLIIYIQVTYVVVVLK